MFAVIEKIEIEHLFVALLQELRLLLYIAILQLLRSAVTR